MCEGVAYGLGTAKGRVGTAKGRVGKVNVAISSSSRLACSLPSYWEKDEDGDAGSGSRLPKEAPAGLDCAVASCVEDGEDGAGAITGLPSTP